MTDLNVEEYKSKLGDKEILRLFEIADDQLISIHGYFLYSNSCDQIAPLDEILKLLPAHLLPHTHIWDLIYDPKIMASNFKNLFKYYHIRRCFVAMVDVFSVVVRDFIGRLIEAGFPQSVKYKGYQHDLWWVFEKLKNPTYPNDSMKIRTPDLCSDVDNARIIRNIFVHNNGIISQGFLKKPLPQNKRPLKNDPDILLKILQPLLLTSNDLVKYSRSHIELLHILHEKIQREDFKATEVYDYSKIQKVIRWDRILVGY